MRAAAIIASIIFHWTGSAWGSVGGASEGDVKLNLVGSVGLPMPKAPVVDDSKTFDPTNSLFKEQPQPKPPEIPKDVEKIPQFEKEKPPKQIEHKSKVFENKTPPPNNAVPGHGGQMNVPTGYQQTPGAASPGVAVSGPAGGDFAGRYPAYVEAIRRRIAQNWLQSSITHHPCRRNLHYQSRRLGEGYSHHGNKSQFVLRQFRLARLV